MDDDLGVELDKDKNSKTAEELSKPIPDNYDENVRDNIADQNEAQEEETEDGDNALNESSTKPDKSEGEDNDQVDDIDLVKTDFPSETVEDPCADPHLDPLINPIDLVLMEIGEQTPSNIDDNSEAKKLTFGIEDDKDRHDNDKEQQQSCSNPEFRYKVLDTIFLFWNTTTMGWVYGQMGPALPDLQFLVGASLQEATWVFTGFAIGYLGGCLLAGLIQDRFNPRMMLFLYTLGTAITISVLPWLPVLPAMVAIRVINGICIGGQDTGLHSMLFAIWSRDGGPFVQMTHVLSALGGILAPLVTQPFVSQSTVEIIQTASNKINATYNLTILNTTSSITESYVNVTQTHPSSTSRSTNIHYAFLITGILVCTAAVPFLVAFLQKRRIMMASRQYSNESVDKNKLPKNIKHVVLIILCINSFIATAYIDLFPSFLTTFVMQQVSWSQQSASTITSVYFATYAAGNFIGVFILAYITSTKLIVFSYISSAFMILGFLLSVLFNHTELIWVTVALAGLTMSGILPTLFTWTQEHVNPITARLASILLISGSAGVMVNPLLLGYMMEQLSPMWFIYLSLGETILCAMLFATVFTLSRLYSAQKSTKTREISALNEDIKQDEEDSESKTEIYPRGTLYGI